MIRSPKLKLKKIVQSRREASPTLTQANIKAAINIMIHSGM